MDNDFGGNSYPYDGEVQPDEKTMALLAHILAIVTWFVGPLIIWIIKKDQSEFIRKHALEALAFSLTVTVVNILAGILIYLLMLIIWIGSLLYFILGAIRANEGKIFEYPISTKFVK